MTILAAALWWSSPAQAQGIGELPTSGFGGRVADRRHAFVSVGFPDVEGGVRFPLGRFDLTARFRFSYGTPAFASIPNGFAFAGGTDLRWMVLDSGALTGVVIGSVHVGPALGDAPVAVGIGLLSPGFLITYRFSDLVDLTVGAQLQADLWVQAGGVFFWGAVPIIAAGEIRVKDGITLGLRIEVGPSFVGGDVFPLGQFGTASAGLVGGRVRASLGTAIDF